VVVFERTERQFFRGQDATAVVQTIQQALYASGVMTQQTGPAGWSGRGVSPSYGLVPKVSIFAAPSPDGFSVDVRIMADTEGSGIIVAIVLWFVFFPAALIVGYMAYQDFVQRQAQLFNSVWAPLGHLIVAPNYPAPQFGAPPPGDYPR
jgi:hypothetical protein